LSLKTGIEPDNEVLVFANLSKSPSVFEGFVVFAVGWAVPLIVLGGEGVNEAVAVVVVVVAVEEDSSRSDSVSAVVQLRLTAETA